MKLRKHASITLEILAAKKRHFIELIVINLNKYRWTSYRWRNNCKNATKSKTVIDKAGRAKNFAIAVVFVFITKMQS